MTCTEYGAGTCPVVDSVELVPVTEGAWVCLHTHVGAWTAAPPPPTHTLTH